MEGDLSLELWECPFSLVLGSLCQGNHPVIFLPVHLKELREKEAGVTTGKGRVNSGSSLAFGCLSG